MGIKVKGKEPPAAMGEFTNIPKSFRRCRKQLLRNIEESGECTALEYTVFFPCYAILLGTFGSLLFHFPQPTRSQRPFKCKRYQQCCKGGTC